MENDWNIEYTKNDIFMTDLFWQWQIRFGLSFHFVLQLARLSVFVLIITVQGVYFF